MRSTLSKRVHQVKLITLFSVVAFIVPFEFSQKANSNDWQSEMLNRVNEIRVENGQKLLQFCKPLQLSAQKYADYMAREGFLSHRGRDGSTVGDRLSRSGYLWRKSNKTSYIGENIAAGQQTVKEVVAGWENSPSHFRNMISSHFTHVGFGKSRSKHSRFGIFWVQNFGSGVNC